SAVAGNDVIRFASAQGVVSRAAKDKVQSGPAVDDVAVSAAKELVVAVAPADFQQGNGGALFEVAGDDSPLAVCAREAELRIGVDDVITVAGVEDCSFDVAGLVVDKFL